MVFHLTPMIRTVVIKVRFSFFFFFNDTATTEIYTFPYTTLFRSYYPDPDVAVKADYIHLRNQSGIFANRHLRSEEHTSELQSPCNLVCRLLLEKKKTPPTHPRVRGRPSYMAKPPGARDVHERRSC